MRTDKTYDFETEAEANAFVDRIRADITPDEDKRIYAPVFVDEDVVFKNMPWRQTGKKYWRVEVVTYY